MKDGRITCPYCGGTGQIRCGKDSPPPLFETRQPAEIPVWDEKTKSVHFIPNSKGATK